LQIIYAIVRLVHVSYTGKIVNQLRHSRHTAGVTGYDRYINCRPVSNLTAFWLVHGDVRRPWTGEVFGRGYMFRCYGTGCCYTGTVAKGKF